MEKKSPSYFVLSFKVSVPKQKVYKACYISKPIGINCYITTQKKEINKGQISQSKSVNCLDLQSVIMKTQFTKTCLCALEVLLCILQDIVNS